MVWRARALMSALAAFLSASIGGPTPGYSQSPEEVRAWEHAQAIGTVHEYEVFLQKFPDSVYAPDAVRALLDERATHPTYRSTGEDRAGGGSY